LRFHHRFEWDRAKGAANVRKHHVSFEVAAEVLLDEEADRYHIEEYDDPHSMNEDRWATTASHPADRGIVLRIVWTSRSVEGEDVTRIISARLATRKERRDHEEEVARR